ncbi:hypothetical protein L210DRAFT_569934 [Boletus edulis BED1]|uniref:Uncharacterized protein n=1 Tax=Boletus edulis BED1 TaxID=1328754 RepID=A0AAD4C9A3_BOLED|nr:hypothetical protein L210DRAFT_569934 [Boletus edulis BED1]
MLDDGMISFSSQLDMGVGWEALEEEDTVNVHDAAVQSMILCLAGASAQKHHTLARRRTRPTGKKNLKKACHGQEGGFSPPPRIDTLSVFFLFFFGALFVIVSLFWLWFLFFFFWDLEFASVQYTRAWARPGAPRLVVAAQMNGKIGWFARLGHDIALSPDGPATCM